MRRAVKDGGTAVVVVPRSGAVEFLRERLGQRRGRAALVHLAWPNLRGVQSTASASGAAAEGWGEYVQWSVALREACSEGGAWFIGIGTGIEACAEDPAVNLAEPYRSYARRKTELMKVLERPSQTSWVRLHYIFGPYEDPSRLVPSAIRACLKGVEFACGARHRRRHWLYVEDVAALIADFAAAPVTGIWDIAGRQELSFDELLGLVERAVERPLRLAEAETNTADSRLAVVAPTNLASIVPATAGCPENLLARLKDYAHWIEARGQ